MKAKSVEAIVGFLPIFEQDGYDFGDWDIEDGFLPGVRYSKDVDDFIEALYREGFVLTFDWPQWQDEASRIVEDTAALQKADIETIRKLLTTHVRKDRFCEGHLLAMLQTGHINAILCRLNKILGEMPGKE